MADMDFVAEQSVASLTKRATLKGCSFAEGEGFLLWQATASITNPWVFIPHKKRATLKGCSFAEGEGFKPPIPERGIPDFESSAFGHSANLPIK